MSLTGQLLFDQAGMACRVCDLQEVIPGLHVRVDDPSVVEGGLDAPVVLAFNTADSAQGPTPWEANPVVPKCGACGIEFRQAMGYSCPRQDCPVQPRITY